MIKLTAQRHNDGYVYRIEAPGHQPFVTASEAHTTEHLRALGVEGAERLVEQAKEWKSVEVRASDSM